MSTYILRTQHEDAIYFVKNITIQESFLMLPQTRVNEIIKGSLARAAELHQVKIYAFIFLLNRYEILLSAPRLNLPEFMKTLQQELAMELNIAHKRKGKFFARRYQKSEVLDKEALLERYASITCAAIEAGLSPTPDGWAGVSSWDYFLQSTPIQGTRLNRTVLGELKRKAKNKRKRFTLPANAGQEDYQFSLARLPDFEKQPAAAHRRFIENMVNAHAKDLKQSQPNVFANIRKLKKLHWSTTPASLEARRARVKKPCARSREAQQYQLCYGKPAAQAAFKARYHHIRKIYAHAMKIYIEEYDASKFPVRTCRPGLISCEKPKGWVLSAPASRSSASFSI